MREILLNDKNYPVNLLQIDTPPKKLYIRGTIQKSDRKAVAIVGAREMTQYGKEMAWHFATHLASSGITIISGMARGIDTTAHTGALEIGGRTLAVLGCGLDVVYPPENKKLAENICKSGALLTEFPLSTPPLGKNFLIRNRIISGLSLAVLVIEGKRKSGTLSTASCAAQQGIEVFAVPGPVNSRMSDLPNFLIENGARMARDHSDIVEYVNQKFDMTDTQSLT